jgi:hypothetical protein
MTKRSAVQSVRHGGYKFGPTTASLGFLRCFATAAATGGWLRALRVPVGRPPEVIELEDEVRGLQEAVGGFFERIGCLLIGPGRVADVWCDDEGRTKDLPENRLVIIPDGYKGVVRGPIVITSSETQDEDGATYSLTDAEIVLCKQVVAEWPVVE